MSGETKRRELRLFVPVEMVFVLCFTAEILLTITSSLEANNGGPLNTRGPTDINNGTITHYACEHNKLQMSCRENESIRVVEANYGRRAYEICNEDMPNQPTHWDTNCSMANKSLSLVRRLCDRKSSCTVFGSNSFFGDPCEGTEKYLEVTYQCIPKLVCSPHCSQHGCDVAGEYKCDGCDFGYGLAANGTCDACSAHCRVHGCNVAGAFKCDQCDYGFSLTANGTCNDARVPTDINNGTIANYIYACEHNELHMSCGENESIRAVQANYGRRAYEICNEAMPNKPTHWNMNCSTERSLSVVRRLCDRKSNCTVIGSNWLFRDPCEGTDKYLEVTYKCLPKLACSAHCRMHGCDVAGAFKCDRCDFPFSLTANGTCNDTREPTDINNGTITHYACDRNELRLGCRENETIRVFNANYGRSDNQICSGAMLNESKHYFIDCSYKIFASTVRNLCNRKSNCTVIGTDWISGHLCEDIDIYLEATYQCMPIWECSMYCTQYYCDVAGEYKCDKCDFGYGIAANGSCHACSAHCSRRGCNVAGAFKCDRCDFGFSLTANGTCESYAETTRKPTDIINGTITNYRIVCQNEELQISCRENERIHVLDANYGRLTPHICNGYMPNDTTHWSTNCSSNRSMSVVRRRCDEKSSCWVTASIGFFGEPCSGTDKYLEVTYQCKSANTSKENTTNGLYSMTEPRRIQYRRGRIIHYSALTAWMTPEPQISITTQPVDEKLCQDLQVGLGLEITGIVVILVLVIIIFVLFFKNRSLRKVKREFDNESQHSLNTYEEFKMQKHHQDYERTRLCDSSSTAWI